MRAPIPRWAGWAVRLLLTIAVTYFLFRALRVSWRGIAEQDLTLWRPRVWPLLASAAVLLAVFAYLVTLWSRMVRELGGPRLRLSDATRIFFVANLGRYVPGKVWQLAGLAYLAKREGVEIAVASSAAILGQLFALGAAVVVTASALALGAGGEVPADVLPWAVALAALVTLVTVLPGALRLTLRLVFRFGPGAEAAPALGPWFGGRWLAIYLPAWIGYGIAFGLLWSAFPALPAVSWPAAVGAFAGSYFLGYAAVFAPAGLGVREGAMALLLAPWMAPGPSAVLAVIARLWMTLAELIPVAGVGVGFLWRRLTGRNERADHA